MMNIIGLQLVLTAFALFMMYVLLLHWRKNNISNVMFFSWLLIWCGFLVVTFFPALLEPLLKELFLVRVIDFGTIVAFMIITYVSIENNVKIRKQDEQIEKLVRKLALSTKK